MATKDPNPKLSTSEKNNVQAAQEQAHGGATERPAPQQLGIDHPSSVVTTDGDSSTESGNIVHPDVAGIKGNEATESEDADLEQAAAEDERQAEAAFQASVALLQRQREDDAAVRAAAAVNKLRADKDQIIPLAEASRRSGINAEDLDGVRKTKALLDKYDKVTIMIAQNPRGQKPKDDVPVTINDYTFLIKPGYLVQVPLPVAEILVNAGHVLPMDERLMAFQRDLEPEIEALKIKYL